MWPFFNLTIEVVTFRLHEWCMLSVFLLLALIPSRTWMTGTFGSMRWNAHVHTLDLVYTLIQKCLGNGVRTHVNSKGKITSTRSSEEGQTGDAAWHRTAKPSTLLTELFQPYTSDLKLVFWQLPCQALRVHLGLQGQNKNWLAQCQLMGLGERASLSCNFYCLDTLPILLGVH